MEKWDKECDVLVVGYGFAGATAAITAHDAGAKVLILEKGEYPGGCSILAGGGFKFVQELEGGVRYFTQISGGRVDAELIRAFVEGLAGNLEFAREMAKIDGAEIQVTRLEANYPYEGRDALGSFMVFKVPGFTGFPWLHGALPRGPIAFKMLMDNVEARGIEVVRATPARRLLTDGAGSILGILAENGGKELAVKARRAVILACGGFEQNEWLIRQSLQGMPFHSMGPLTNTGDGILMAQQVGAALWHMWHVHGSYGFKFPGYPLAFRHSFSGPRNPKSRVPWIVVDKLGRRYMDEYPPAPQDTPHRPMEVFDPDLPGYPRIPSFMIFDEEGRKLRPIADPMGLKEHSYEWSKDNSREVQQGWIISAESIPSLAEKIKELPENEGKMELAILEETLGRWNQQAKAGKDPFGRPPDTMMPLETPPFYGVPVWPIITNTQGGPVHNGRQQILDTSHQPIPRLYAAGELGSFFGHLYELGGNLGECLGSGRIAGRNAAAEKAWGG